MSDFYNDKRIVMTLDAGGTNFAFSAIKGGKQIIDTIILPSFSSNKEKCLSTIVDGFKRVKEAIVPNEPEAISFAFPGPADYKNGVIGDLANFPSFKGGVALGPMLEEIFNIPTYINNDGDLFAYGESVGGFLPYINNMLQENGVKKRYNNLLGITLGTGYGSGVVVNGQLCTGDNSAAGELWLTQNCLMPNLIAEESVSIRGIERVYKRESNIDDGNFTPEDIYLIAKGLKIGNQNAALRAFEEMGIVIGESLVNVISLIDAAVVIGGGISGASEFIMPAIIKHLNGMIGDGRQQEYKRIIPDVYCVEDCGNNKFLKEAPSYVQVPFSNKEVVYNKNKKTPIGMSKLGTNEAIWLGAYTLALTNLDRKVIV